MSSNLNIDKSVRISLKKNHGYNIYCQGNLQCLLPYKTKHIKENSVEVLPAMTESYDQSKKNSLNTIIFIGKISIFEVLPVRTGSYDASNKFI